MLGYVRVKGEYCGLTWGVKDVGGFRMTREGLKYVRVKGERCEGNVTMKCKG